MDCRAPMTTLRILLGTRIFMIDMIFIFVGVLSVAVVAIVASLRET